MNSSIANIADVRQMNEHEIQNLLHQHQEALAEHGLLRSKIGHLEGVLKAKSGEVVKHHEDADAARAALKELKARHQALLEDDVRKSLEAMTKERDALREQVNHLKSAIIQLRTDKKSGG